MKLAAFVSLRPTEMILGFSRTKLTEVFSRLRNHIGEKFKLDTAKWFAWMMLEIGSSLTNALESSEMVKNKQHADVLVLLTNIFLSRSKSKSQARVQ